MKAVHTVNSLRASHGGPSRSVTSLCSALVGQGVSTTIVTHRPENAAEIVRPAGDVALRFAERESGQRIFLPGPSAFGSAVTAELAADTLVHDHGLWLPSNHATARAARRVRAPRMVSVRGMLSAWALGNGQAKKRLAWMLYQRADLQGAVLHATSQAEVEAVRTAGLTGPAALIPNGVELPSPSIQHERGAAPRRALFLSRLHPGKGVLDLVRAWAEVRPVDWELVLAGPDEGGHRAEIEVAIAALGIGDAVRFTGPVDDETKWTLYSEADVFILPTYSENFGLVVAEALAAGVPAITTKGAPWQALQEHDCGWWVDIGPESVAAALEQATDLGDEERAVMGARGRALIEGRYTWSSVAEEMKAVYGWMLGHHESPASIVT